ncbi:glycoside hydrolase [Mucilaginibacter pedocola]|uniref:Glycoside hydrolase n=2 Tax=Mucilaginibacter pedocola TaxID=1792845 RepID=A0A1S9PD65_9SPHI|nr:glycoside hydrolase [Mucilaginibacter pedocola]
MLCFAGINNLQAQTKTASPKPGMVLNNLEYLEYGSVNVMLAHDFYPEGHQGGVGIIQNGLRTATNGDLRLEPTPGQWSPIPKVGKRVINKATHEISVRMEYPNPEINRKGFNPIIYPDLNFAYNIRVLPVGKAFKIIVDLDKPLPDAWIGKVGFNIELFPGILFGKSFYADEQFGIFPLQSNSQMVADKENEYQTIPIAAGKKITVAPELPEQRLVIENLKGDKLQLLDGRSKHNNGWFVVRSLIAKGAAKGAIEWLVTPNAIPGWRSAPVVQVSQVGYHPSQQKIAVIELDKHDKQKLPATLYRVKETGGLEAVLKQTPADWGNFLRYHYLHFDFSSVKKPGMYIVKYGNSQTETFQISDKVFSNDVWQPTLEYFLPAQMCHMRVNDKYRVWHGLCHMDDARMAPIDSNHFDGYIQGHSTLTKFKPGDNVPYLNRGAWHDAGDFDIRVESQAETVHGLTLAYEAFDVKYDNTTIDQQNHIVEIQQPDGKPDMLQQIEHGLLTITGGYQAMGRFYRGIIEPTLRQYVLLGDAANLTDNLPYKTDGSTIDPILNKPAPPDDRWLFTEENTGRTLHTAVALAAASRVMKGYNDTLSKQCLQIATEVWNKTEDKNIGRFVPLAVELLITTDDKKYADFLVKNQALIVQQIQNTGWMVGRALKAVNNAAFTEAVTTAVKGVYSDIQKQGLKTPYGVPYEPNIWGAGWGIQNFGYKQYFLCAKFPQIFSDKYMLNSINFILGCHPGSNTSSFVSGVGAKSMTTAYGANRADWSYIPGGSASGTALIRPDFPELLKWPYLWQQGEYVLGGGTSDYLFLVLAADRLLNKK